MFLQGPNTCLCMMGSQIGVCCHALHLQVASPCWEDRRGGGRVWCFHWTRAVKSDIPRDIELQVFEAYFKTT